MLVYLLIHLLVTFHSVGLMAMDMEAEDEFAVAAPANDVDMAGMTDASTESGITGSAFEDLSFNQDWLAFGLFVLHSSHDPYVFIIFLNLTVCCPTNTVYFPQNNMLLELGHFEFFMDY